VKRRIEQLLNGKFEYNSAPMIFSTETVEGKADADSRLSGSFSAAAQDKRRVKGFVYSSNPRVRFEPHKFYGSSVLLNWQLDTKGARAGEKIEGFFTFCTERGEYSVPYTFVIRETEGEDIPDPEKYSVDALCALAKKSMPDACTRYAAPEFEEELKKNDTAGAVLYRALKPEGREEHGLEEFLIGCGKKVPAQLFLDQTVMTIHAPKMPTRMTLPLHMAGWGYLDISIDSDDRFIRPEKKKITSDDFVGGHYNLNYFIDTNFLHSGRNFGRLYIRTCYQTVSLDITVINSTGSDEAHEMHVRKLMRRKMLTLYLDFRQKRIDRQNWIDRSVNVLNGYRRAGGKNVFADLLEAQLCYADGKKARGLHVLNELEHHMERFQNQDQYAYYLYLTTFFRQDKEYVDQIETRIGQMFIHSRNSWIMQWILLYLQEQYIRDDSAKLEAIEHQVLAGCSSPIMYLEAARIYRKNPYLLRKLGSFELRILLFSVKEGMVTEELASQISSLAVYDAVYDSRLMRILSACYDLTKSPDTVRAICQILIAGNKKDPSWFRWYALGVNLDLRITGLYEYYIETMGTVGIEKMPQIVRMYFSYSTSLNYHKKAAIYRDISDKRESVPQVYRDSHASIEHFVAEQLSMEHIDSNLAVLYERFLTRRLLNRTQAEHLVRLLFTYEVTCSNPNMKTVRVVHRRLNHIDEFPLRNGKTKIRIYTNDACIMLSDAEGKCYTSQNLYRMERYMDSPLLITYCRELVPDDPGLVLYMCSVTPQITDDTLVYFRHASSMEDLTAQTRLAVRRKILCYYMDNMKADGLYAFLKELPLDEYVESGKKELICLLTEEGFYEQAFALIENYGAETVPPNVLVCILSQTVLAREYEEDDALVQYCSICFTYGKYDENILNYLLMYYDGPIESMKRVWNIAAANNMDTMQLESKILSLLLFTRTGGQNTEHIFESYRKKLGNRKICTAYLNLKSYEYLVKNLPVNDCIFRDIENDMRKGIQVETVCRLALMQYYSTLPVLSQEQKDRARSLLSDFDDQGMHFAFYQRFDREINGSYSTNDKVFMEYVTDPSHTVILYYRYDDGEFVHENMKNMFEGIFVREFVIFKNEKVECYLEEYDGDTLLFTGSRRILTAPELSASDNSRYALLSRMNERMSLQDEKGLEDELRNYYQLENLTKAIFTLI